MSNCWFRHDIEERERVRERELHGQCQGERLTEFTGLSIMDREAFFSLSLGVEQTADLLCTPAAGKVLSPGLDKQCH